MSLREVDEKLCFVLMPFKKPFDDYYEDVIKPAVMKADLFPKRADEIYSVNPFMTDVWSSIWQARVVLAELTGRNVNVMYELGLCHAVDVPTVLISQRVDDIPSDFRHLRCIIYNPDSLQKLGQEITNTLWQIKTDERAGLLLPDVGQREPTFKKRFADLSANQRRLYRFIYETYQSSPVGLEVVVSRLSEPDFQFKEDGTVDYDEAYYRLMTMVHLNLLVLLPDRQWRKSKFRIPPRMAKLLQQHGHDWLAD